jgi:hypothetical protein
MTWLGFLNYFLLQFFCIRLTRTYVNKTVAIADRVTHETYELHGFRIMYWVVPFTGWDKWNYKFIGKRFYYSPYIWKRK